MPTTQPQTQPVQKRTIRLDFIEKAKITAQRVSATSAPMSLVVSVAGLVDLRPDLYTLATVHVPWMVDALQRQIPEVDDGRLQYVLALCREIREADTWLNAHTVIGGKKPGDVRVGADMRALAIVHAPALVEAIRQRVPIVDATPVRKVLNVDQLSEEITTRVKAAVSPRALWTRLKQAQVTRHFWPKSNDKKAVK